MTGITQLLVMVLILAGLSDYVNMRRRERGDERKEWVFTFAIIAVLSIYGGLRTRYNDTFSYVHAFELIDPSSFIGRSMDIGSNPGFYALNVLFKRISEDYHIFLLTTTTFTQACIIMFFRRYTKSMTLSVLIFIMSGSYAFTVAAIKQCLATGLSLIATHFAIRKKWVPYALILFVAITIHPYAFLYLVVPFLFSKPWTSKTYIILALAAVIGFVFSEFLDVILDITQAIGEEYTEETLKGEGVNALRLAVYAVPVVMSFVWKDELYKDSTREENLINNLTVLCFALMFVALFGTANVFARLANYFNVFMMISLPWMLLKTKVRLKPFIIYIAVFCYSIYFYYSYFVNIHFDEIFSRITLISFIRDLF